ncbi:hypothetical protein Salat_1195700 [Sesamum alatum]|uniref:Subtilisin-like protease fibronectin type-III domain-containing protein n=1 Tax=Sesamum alatum TaxID=300844 RepID=A0AAE2CNT2_9LAMI|nr:hypothetical protein Salat_1195700 [Sesamum alatum]
MSKGVLVSQASGNSGPSLNTIPSRAPWVLVPEVGTLDQEFTGTSMPVDHDQIEDSVSVPAEAFEGTGVEGVVFIAQDDHLKQFNLEARWDRSKRFIPVSRQKETLVSQVIKWEKIISFNVESGISMTPVHAADVLDNLLNPFQEWGYNQAATRLGVRGRHNNPNKAIDLDLIYEVNRDDRVNFLYALNLTQKHIRAIIRLPYRCSNLSIEPNYPSFLIYFKGNETKTLQLQGTLTNIGTRKSSYFMKLDSMQEFKVSMKPNRLVFISKYEQKCHKLKVECPCLK